MADTIFDEDELAADAIAPDSSEQEVQTATETPARDEHGRFAPKGDEPDLSDAPDPAEEDPAVNDKSRQVPQGALHAERERRKTAETNYKAAQAQLDALTQMRAQIAARQPQPIEAPGEDPASETAYLRQRFEQIEATQQNMVQNQQLEQVDTAERQHLGSILTQSEAEYRSVKPDYDAAISHVITARAQELALYGLSPMEVQNALQQEVLDITRSAIQQGRAPAEVGYQLAMLRGYRPDATQEPAQQQGQAQRTVEAVGQARASSRSLGQAAGGGNTRDLNAQTVVNMGPEEFAALYSTPEGKRMIDSF